MSNPSVPGQTVQPVPQGSMVYRSHSDICRILQFIASDRCPVSAEIGGGKPFMSHILSIDDPAGHFVLAYSANKPANSALFKQPSLEFTADHQGAHIVFRVSGPADMMFDGRPALQFVLPQSVAFYHRRKQQRTSVPEDMSLRCVADEGGVISFEARITDISLDGMGGIFYSADILLGAGTVLKGSRIIIPGGKAIIADLEVRYTKTVTLQDGTQVNRAGVRFMQRPREIEELVGMFAQDTDGEEKSG